MGADRCVSAAVFQFSESKAVIAAFKVNGPVFSMQWTSAVCHLEEVDLILARGWTQQENIHISIKEKKTPNKALWPL